MLVALASANPIAIALSPASELGTAAGAAARPKGAAAGAGAAATTKDAPAAETVIGGDARAILERVCDSYLTFRSYQFNGMIHVEMTREGKNESLDMPMHLAASKPGKIRNEIENPTMKVITVCDGREIWMYVPQLNQYVRKPWSPGPPDVANPDSAMAVAMMMGTPLGRYASMTRGLRHSKLLREEPLTLVDRTIDCYVVEAEYEAPPGDQLKLAPALLWIDKSRHVVLQEVSQLETSSSAPGGASKVKQTTFYPIARLNETLPDSLFAYRPPASAEEVSELGPKKPPVTDFPGQAAFEFTLDDLQGKPRKLSAWRGKVVLLDFWASWCGPCRIELPTIAKLHARYKTRGLVVVGVNVGEPAATARSFWKRNGYTFPVLLDKKSEVSNQYGAVAIPTVVVIDRKGVISSHFVGVRSEDDFVEALKRAGIK